MVHEHFLIGVSGYGFLDYSTSEYHQHAGIIVSLDVSQQAVEIRFDQLEILFDYTTNTRRRPILDQIVLVL